MQRNQHQTKLGKFTEARQEIERAVAMTQNKREHELLTKKLESMTKQEA